MKYQFRSTNSSSAHLKVIASLLLAGVSTACGGSTSPLGDNTGGNGGGSGGPASNAQISLVTAYDAGIQVENLKLASDRKTLFLSGWVHGTDDTLRAQGVQLIDIANPIAPYRISSVQMGGGSSRLLALTKDERTLFVSRVFGPVAIIDVSDRSAPRVLGTYPESGYGLALSSDEKTGFLAVGDSGVHILDLSDLTAPRLIGRHSVSSPCMINGQAVFSGNCSAASAVLLGSGPLLFVPSAWGGLKVVNVQTPSAPTAVTTLDAQGNLYARLLISRGGTIGYAGGSNGPSALRILDLSNPTTPKVIASLDNGFGGYSGMALSSDATKLFLAGQNIGMQIVDVSKPTSPKVIATFAEVIANTAPTTVDVAVSADTIAYLAGGVNGLRVVRVRY